MTFLKLTGICKYPQSNAMKKFYTALVRHLSNIYIGISLYRYIYIEREKGSVFSSVLTPERSLDFLSGWAVSVFEFLVIIK